MNHIVSPCLALILLVAGQVSGRGEFRVGGPDGNPGQDLLSEESAGTYVIFDGEGRQTGSVPVNVTPHGVAADTLIDFAVEDVKDACIL